MTRGGGGAPALDRKQGDEVAQARSADGSERSVKRGLGRRRRWRHRRPQRRPVESLQAAFGFPQYQIHRADLLAALELEVTAQLWMGPGRHFIHYFVRDRRLLCFVAIVEQDTWIRESWTDRGHLGDAQAAFAGWHPQVRAILAAADDSFLTALFDRPPLERWSAGRVTLLGDACHPMLPFMAQGAVQAIEDGATLTACLTQAGPDVPGALRRYKRLRRPRTARLQALSAANKTRLHLPDGPQQQARDAQLATGSTDWSVGTVAWIYEHDPAVLDLTHAPS